MDVQGLELGGSQGSGTFETSRDRFPAGSFDHLEGHDVLSYDFTDGEELLVGRRRAPRLDYVPAGDQAAHLVV
jgi:hypothetical protein